MRESSRHDNCQSPAHQARDSRHRLHHLCLLQCWGASTFPDDGSQTWGPSVTSGAKIADGAGFIEATAVAAVAELSTLETAPKASYQRRHTSRPLNITPFFL